MQTILRKIWADVRSRLGRTVLVSTSILVGVFGVVLLVGMGDLVVSQLEEDMNPDEIAMTHVYLQLPHGETTLEQNRAYLADLAQLPGVTDVEGRADYPVGWLPAGAQGRYEDGVIRAFTEPFGENDLEPIARVLEGRFPEPGQHEVVVERRFAETHGIGVGDSITFRPASPDAERHEWQVVGVVAHAYMTASPLFQAPVPFEDSIYAAYDDAQTIAGFKGLTSVYARYTSFSAAEEGLDDFLAAVEGTPVRAANYIPIMNFMDDPDDSYILDVVSQVTGILDMLGIIAMVVSGFLVINVINSIVVEQKGQIGTMKSLGATRVGTFLIYAGMALIYGMIGTLLGVLVGVPVAGLLAQELASTAFTYIDGIRISALGVLTALVMGLLVPVLVSLVPVYNGTRVTILEAMTDLGIASNWGQGRLSRIVGALPLPINARQALSNLVQKRGRLALTLLTLTLAVAAFMGVMAVFITLDDQISGLAESFTFDLTVQPQVAQDFDEMAALLASVEGVDGVYPGYFVAVRVEGYESTGDITSGSDQIFAAGLSPDDPIYAFDYSAGDGWASNVSCVSRDPAEYGGVDWMDDPQCMSMVINGSVAESIDKGVGDTVTVTVADSTREFQIIGVDKFPFDQVFFRWDVLAQLAGFVDAAGNPQPGTFYVRTALDDPSIEQTEDVIAAIDETLVAAGIPATYTNQAEVDQTNQEALLPFVLMFNITSGVLAAVGAIGLLATLSMSVNERQKEIGVMRSIGARSRTVAVQFLIEGVLVGLVAWLVGLPLSYLLSQALTDALPFDAGMATDYPPVVMVMGLVGMLVIATVASLWPSISAARKTVSNILRYQ